MPHVTFVPFSGFRVRADAMRELGMTLPGLRQRASAIAELPALGLLTLAGMLPDRWTCSYQPAEHCDEGFIEAILSERPTLVAVSALTASITEAYRFSKELQHAGVPVVMGGLHVTVCPDEARQHCSAIVVGEGERVWPQVLADVESGTLQKEYRARGDEGQFLAPVPRYDLLGPDPPRFTVQTQRGCPLACEFCGASRLLGSFHEKPADYLRRELEVIRRLDPNPLVELADDNTFAGARDVAEFCAVFAESGARWFTEADWRIGERPELLARLAQAGCVQVLVGIESLVFRYPGMGAKRAELDRIMNAVEAVQEAGVAVNGCFIVGAEGETRDSLDRLGEFILDAPLAEVQLTLQTPFPGTGLYRRLKRHGRLLPERGWPFYTLFDVTYRPDVLSVEELERGFRDLLRCVFSGEAARKRERIRREVWHRNARLRRGAVATDNSGFN